MSKRAITIKNLKDKKFVTLKMSGLWGAILGEPEISGAWLIYGVDKNGKTWCALKLAEYLSSFAKVIYVSAEEGTSKSFVDAIDRAKLDKENKKLHFTEYMPLEDLIEKLEKRKSAKIIFIDNLTMYSDDIKKSDFHDLLSRFPDKLFVFLAHEENKQPYTATAKLCKRLAKIIVRVQGLKCFVSGRCPGGSLEVDEEKASLFHGTQYI